MPQPADDVGYRLWLRYDRMADAGLLAEARAGQTPCCGIRQPGRSSDRGAPGRS